MQSNELFLSKTDAFNKRIIFETIIMNLEETQYGN